MNVDEILKISLNNGNPTRGNPEDATTNQVIQSCRISSGTVLVKTLKGLIYCHGVIVQCVLVIRSMLSVTGNRVVGIPEGRAVQSL